MAEEYLEAHRAEILLEAKAKLEAINNGHRARNQVARRSRVSQAGQR
jgi:hypothetical protein